MENEQHTNDVLLKLSQWVERQPAVRAMLLTSSRANPKAIIDVLSDYDILLIVQDIHPFFKDRSWLWNFGEVLVSYWDPIHSMLDYGIEKASNVIHYSDGLHIDFDLWPVELMAMIINAGRLPDSLDMGYEIINDKDRLTNQLPKPTYQAYIPKAPTEEEFVEVVESFFSDVPYVAKCLKRDELLPAKWCLDFDMKHNFLRKMLVWRMEMDFGWSVPAGNLGKGLKKRLPYEIWLELESTYTSADIEENWEALFRMLTLFRKVGITVAEHLGYSYPLKLDQGVTAYAVNVKNIDN
jgi:aminoglycoside 6-adenylyltransferase